MSDDNKHDADTEARLTALEALVDHLLELVRDRPETVALRRRLEGLRDNSADQGERENAERMLRGFRP